MKPSLAAEIVTGLLILVMAEPAETLLPRPHYEKQTSDPAWLACAVQFHGHLGPWATAGFRLGAAARQAVKADGYFDIEICCEGPFAMPPRACFLDGVQVATGATWGKRNIHWTDAEQIAVHVTNTQTNKTAIVRPKPELLKHLASVVAGQLHSQTQEEHDHDRAERTARLESVARRIASAAESDLLTIEYPPSEGSPTK